MFALRLDDLPAFRESLGPSVGLDQRALTLARALASSPAWGEMGGAAIVVRSSPSVLGLVGSFDDRAVARIEALRQQLVSGLPRLRYVSYPEVEADCEALAERLTDRFGRKEITRMDFAAIPRGGVIVLGILSYFLDLQPHRITDLSRRRRRPLVVVDDCSVSGIRFGEVLAQLRDRPVMFAALYSHPDLRNSILARESKVTAVMSARDLNDYAPSLLGSEYSSWRERWSSRPGHEGYWIGLPEHLSFPWSEIDVDFWNPVSQQGEVGWRLIPPELCLKNRVAAAGPQAPEIQRQPNGKGPIAPSSTTLFAELDGRIVIGNWASRETVALEGVAARMWLGIVEHGNPQDVVASLQSDYTVTAADLQRDLASFLEEMERRGFLARVSSARMT